MKLPLDDKFRKPAFSVTQDFVKRLFDLTLSIALFPVVLLPMVILIFAAKIFNGKGLFAQKRVGRYGEAFKMFKICSMKDVSGFTTTVTTDNDPRITKFGFFIRKTKLDELPQLWNIFRGEMSFVGPRPDVPMAYKNLSDEDSIILCIRPGVTGPASLAFKDEETILAEVKDPDAYSEEVIFPQKVHVNKNYISEQSIWLDLKIILMTILRVFFK